MIPAGSGSAVKSVDWHNIANYTYTSTGNGPNDNLQIMLSSDYRNFSAAGTFYYLRSNRSGRQGL